MIYMYICKKTINFQNSSINSCDFREFPLKTHGRLITSHGETVIFTMFYYWKKNYKPLMVYKRN